MARILSDVSTTSDRPKVPNRLLQEFYRLNHMQSCEIVISRNHIASANEKPICLVHNNTSLLGIDLVIHKANCFVQKTARDKNSHVLV